MKVKLTHQFIRGYEANNERDEIFDKHTPGLGIRITKKGTKSFFYRYKFSDRSRRYTLGRFPDLSLAKARKKVERIKNQIYEGKDPQAEKQKRKKKDVKTIEDLATKYKEKHFPTLKESSRRTYKSRINSEILPAFGKYPINDIQRSDVIILLDEIANERKQGTHANRVRAIFSSMYTFAVQHGYAEYNPIQYIKPLGKENIRDRVYSEEELKKLWEAFDEENEPINSLLKVLVLTGQRFQETASMKWHDLDNDIWRIPAENNKANRTHYLPLPEQTLDIIWDLEHINGDSRFVFNSPVKKDQPVRNSSEIHDRIKERSKIVDFRIHDLRRTVATFMKDQVGVNRTTLGKVLNHKSIAGDNRVTAVYDQYDYMDEKRKAMKEWNRILSGIVEPFDPWEMFENLDSDEEGWENL